MKLFCHIIIVMCFLVPKLAFDQDAVNNSGNFHIGATNITFFSDLTNTGSFTSSAGTIYFSGSEQQNLTGSSAISVYNTILNNTDGIKLDNELEIENNFTFTDGIVVSDRSDFSSEYVHFLDGATHTGVSNSSHVNGVVRKTGDDSFSFPVGDSGQVQPILISAPASVTDEFTAYYREENPDDLFDVSAMNMGCFSPSSKISTCEYWRLEQTSGTSNVEVELTWDPNSCGVTAPCELLVSRWSGTEWLSEGNGGVTIITGPSTEGTVTSGNGCGTCGSPVNLSNYGYFTLGSLTHNNPLPVELVDFEATAEYETERVLLTWKTLSEINNDYFLIERSRNGVDWHPLKQVNGAGNSTSSVNYETYDSKPYPGTSYYRLKQVDFDGQFEYSNIETVSFLKSATSFRLYPNPAKETARIETDKEINRYSITDASGKLIFQSGENLETTEISLDLSRYPSGVYFVLVHYDNQTVNCEKLTVTNH